MEVRILGPLEVGAGDTVVPLGGVRLRALLAVLALNANRPVSTERLALALWGEDAPPGATNAIKVQVSRLRRALGDARALQTTPAGYRLVARPDELDTERFEHGLAAAREALAAGHPSHASKLLQDILELWRGPPLEEFAWAPFAPAEIQRLEELHLEATEARVDAELAAGRHAELVPELKRLTAEHPWREHLHVQLMLALYRGGRQAEALAAYRDARRVLVEQLGLEPGEELRDVHRAVLAQDASLVVDRESRRPSGPTYSLPAPPNQTIGRHEELVAVTDRLRAGGTRLLSLTGPGGVGKTRLALEAARAVEPDFADGACLVSLAAVNAAEDVAGALLNALAAVQLPDESAEDAVQRFLVAKHLLLVIDNCEHLPAAAPFIGRLVSSGAGITVMTTTREPLAVNAEQLHPVPPLALPEATAAVDAASLVHVDAVALFCERAGAHDAAFALHDGNAGAVAEICRRLDGLPLAIELAAARCGLLSPAEIAARLDAAFGVLTTGARDAPERQQTLRATLDWSHDLLDPDEQAAFARFAVFAGGASIEAAEAITGADLDTLDRLLAKSLLVRERRAGAATRLGMLETARMYAAERLADAPNRDDVHERHFAYFLDVAHTHGFDSALDGPDGRKHLACLDADVENLRAALRWARGRGDSERVLELSTALVDYWQRCGRAAEAADWILPALRDTAATAEPVLRARALTKAIWPLSDLRRRDELPPLVAEAEALVGRLDDPVARAKVLYNLAAIKALAGHRDEARALADEALATAKVSGDAWTIAMATWGRALAAEGTDEVRERTDEAAARLADVGNTFQVTTVLCVALMSAWERGCDAEAAMYLDRAVAAVRELDHPYRWMTVLAQVGLTALLRGETAAAGDAFREVLALSRRLVLPVHGSVALTGLAAVAVAEGEPERAAELADAAVAHRDARHIVIRRLESDFLDPAGIRRDDQVQG